jgi:hypothetical protein
MRERGSLLGLILRVAYKLRRHRLLGIPMDWLAVLLALAGALILWHRLGVLWAAVVGGLAAMGVLVIWLSGRLDYLIFRRRPEPNPNPAQDGLEADREVSVHATGPFAVHGQERYLVEHPAIYTTPRSREHILMAKLNPTRLLWLGKSDPDAWGWWYQFFRPEMIESIEMGQAIHGWRARPALRIVYWVEDEDERRQTVETVLSFEDRARRSLVWADLTREQHVSGATR